MKKKPEKRREGGEERSRKSVAVVGGILGLEPEYRRILEQRDLLPRIYNRDSASLIDRIKSTDAIILFTGTVSHKMAEKIRRAAKVGGIPLINLQRSSISALRSLQLPGFTLLPGFTSPPHRAKAR